MARSAWAWTVLATTVAACCLVRPAMAAPAADPAIEKYTQEAIAALAACDPRLVQYDSRQGWAMEHTYTGWTGACKAGRRDGHGILTTNSVSIHDSRYPTGAGRLIRIDQREGDMVDGKQVGLWCTRSSELQGNIGEYDTPSAKLCMLEGTPDRTPFMKNAEGAWVRTGWDGKPQVPLLALERGVLEAASERILAQARAGKPIVAGRLSVTHPALAELMAGSRIPLALGERVRDLRNKRVAVVLTSASVTQFQRYEAMRAALISASTKDGKFRDDRTRYIAASDSGAVLQDVFLGLRKRFGGVLPADDFAVLTDGRADYVLLFDWSFEGAFGLTPKEFSALPRCPKEDDPQCHLFFKQSYSGWLINRDLEVVWDPLESTCRHASLSIL